MEAIELAAGGHGGRPLAPETVRKTHVVLRAAFADAERLGFVYRNAAASARPPTDLGDRAEAAHDLSYAGPLRLATPAPERW
jgi:hypothetical protein